MKTVVGLFSTYAQAQQVKQALISNGYESQNVTVVANDDNEMSSSATSTASSSTTGSGAYGAGQGLGEKISGFFRNLSGGDEDAHGHYATGVNSGGALVAVTVADEKAAATGALLTQHGAREIEGTYSSTASTAGTASRNTAATPIASTAGEMAIPIIEEQLVVGKREVDRGGVRVYSHVTERPVDAQVSLHEERINVERRAVNRPATAADFNVGSGEPIELRAMAEEAVVGKTSRVVEEVLVGKQGSDRVEQVHDSVRKTEVEVEKFAGTTAGTGTGTINTPTKTGY